MLLEGEQVKIVHYSPCGALLRYEIPEYTLLLNGEHGIKENSGNHTRRKLNTKDNKATTEEANATKQKRELDCQRILSCTKDFNTKITPKPMKGDDR